MYDWEQENLKNQVIEAWEVLEKHQYEVIEPGCYKEKKGRRMDLLNPWKSLEERMAAEEITKQLWWNHHELYVKYFKETGERVPAPFLYREESTGNGIRWVRR